MTDGLHGLHGRDARTRDDSIEITFTPVGDSRTRYRFEPGETTRWAFYESHWMAELGRWRPAGAVPVYNVQLDIGGQERR